MRKRVVLLFAGQGAQTVGMGKDFYESDEASRELMDQENDALGFSLTKVMFDGPSAELTRTSFCQPALYVHGLVCLQKLSAAVPDLEVAAYAGLSLGEFTAHAAAGTYDFATGLDIVAKRGSFMEESTNETQGSMAAMIGGEEEDVRKLAEACDIDVANLNAPGQIVLSGTKEGIDKSLELASEYGVRIPTKLDVAGAYHSRLMKGAQDKLAGVLEQSSFSIPKTPVICNVDARAVSSEADIRETLTRQVSGSVRWGESIKGLINQGETLFVELGPGRVLAGLMRRIDRKAKALSFADSDSFEKVLEELSD